MKVKELAEILKTSTQELLKILPNVGIDISNGEETFVEKEVEKKLAKRYNIPYPFKTQKQKVAPKPAVGIAVKAAQKQVAPVQAKPAAPVQAKPVAPVQAKPAAPAQAKPAAPAQAKPAAPAQAKPAAPVQAKPAAPVQAKPAAPKPAPVIDPEKEAIKKSFLEEAEEIIPRIDEETLNKYQDFLEDDSYNSVKTSKKKNTQEDSIKARKKNSNKRYIYNF